MADKESRESLACDEPATSSGDASGRGGAEEAEEEREITVQEAEVREMAERIQHFRRTGPCLLAEALSAQLAAQRPGLPAEGEMGLQGSTSQVGIGGPQDEGASEKPELNNGASFPGTDQEMHERLDIFRAKISRNIDTMPNILKRINGCIARIKSLDQCGIEIHPVFKKRRKI
uniref:Pericentrin n=1 Tax=Anthurium amnicola TaxID=1678845 RepID=A0A1D1Y0T2_9ARAE